MSNSEHETMIPADFLPKKPLEYVPIELEHESGFDMLDDAQAGKVIKALLSFSRDYMASFDESLQPNTDGLTDMGRFVLSIATGSAKRRYNAARAIAYRRSGANGGGRPSKTGKT